METKLSVKVVLVLISCVHYGVSIRCFDCNSVNNSMCLNPHLYDPESVQNFLRLTECRQGVLFGNPEGNVDFFCRKIEQTILHKHYEPEIRVTRSCGWKRHYKECYKADNEDHLETVCQCFTDSCNSAPAHTFSAFSLGVFINLLLSFKMAL